MTVSGMNYGVYGFDYSKDIRNNLNVRSDMDKNVQPDQSVQENAPAQASSQDSVFVKAPKILAEGQLEDFSFDFKKNREFSMKGEESDIVSLDLDSDISDARKDDLLDQYRFFAASDDSPVQYRSEDGMVMRVNR